MLARYALIPVTLVASLLPAMAAHAAVVSVSRGSGPSAASVPVGAAKARRAAGSQTDGPGVTRIDRASFPAGGSGDVPVNGAASVGGLPVTVSGVAGPSAKVFKQLGIGAGAATVAAGGLASVRVRVADRSVTAAVGVTGVLMDVSRSDGSTLSGRVRVRVDYSAFANAFGADFGARLHLVALPACALTTPSVPACQTRRDLNAVNAGGALTAEVTVPGAAPASASIPPAAGVVTVPALVMAATSTNSSANGTFSATSLSPAYGWSAGSQGGSFTYGYPLRVPDSLGGPAPKLSLAYDSGVVDGQTLAANGQTSWVGEGWTLDPGYIERSYRSCADDGGSTPDLCWFSDNATMVFNGRSVRLVKDATTGVWHASADDDGLKIEYLTKSLAGNYPGNNYTTIGEYWRVTDLSGTQYYFGVGKRYVGDTGQTYGALPVPVYGNNSGEPCYNATFANAWCWPGYRWNLDYVVDTRGNSMTYVYSDMVGYVGLNNNTNVEPYNINSTLDHIDYGTRAGSEASQTVPMRVTFVRTGRCINACGQNTTDYPDTPWDLYCTSTTSCPNLTTPAYWNPYKLSTVYTQVWNPATSSYRKVDQWDLTYTYPATGSYVATPPANDSSPNMWLQTLTHTGYAADGVTTLAEPTVTFGGTGMFNRVDWGASIGVAPLNHFRVTSILNGAGGQTVVGYSGPDCDTTFTPEVENNPYRCFPEYFKPTQAPAGWGWFHKYVVTGVTEKDLTGGSPDEVWSYAYSTANSSDPALWRHDYTETSLLAQRSWSSWQGYSTVTTTHGAAGGPQTTTTGLYYRGLDGDGQASTDNSAMVWNTRRVGLSVPPTPAGTSAITGSNTNTRCLSLHGGALTNGTAVELGDCVAGANYQVFRFVWNGVNANGTLVNPASGKCIDVVGGGTVNGTGVDLATCSGGANQIWARTPAGQFYNPVSGRCMEVHYAAISNGSAMDIWDCLTNIWNNVWLSRNDGTWILPQTHRCVDVTGGASADGTKIENLWCVPGQASQQWRLTAAGALVNPATNKCADITNSGTADGTLIQLHGCTGGANQVWVPQSGGGLLNPASGKCLDAGPNPYDGIQLTLWTCNGNLQQQWAAFQVDAEAAQGWQWDQQRYNGTTLNDSSIHIPTVTQTAARNAAITPGSGSSAGGQVFAADLVRDTDSYTRTWLPVSSTWRWTETTSAYNSYGLLTATNQLNDTSTATDDVCTTVSYVTPDTTKWLVDFPSQAVTTDCAATPVDADYLAGSQTFYDSSTTNGATPTVGLPTKTMALASVAGGVQTWKQTGRAGYDANGRVTSSYDALDRLTSTAYTPSSAAPVTSVATTNPLLWTTTTNVDPGKGSVTSIVDANGKTSTATYDPLGRVSQAWRDNRPVTATPNAQYTYTLSSTMPNSVQVQTLGPAGVQVSGYQIYDGRLRPRQAQVPTPVANGGRMIADVAYDSRGLAAKASLFYNNASGPSSTLATFTDAGVANQHRYTFDNLGRETTDALYSLGVQLWQTTATYQNDRTAVTPPAGGITTQNIVDARGNTVELRQFTTTNLAGSYQASTYGYDRLSRRTSATDAAGNVWAWSFDLRGRLAASTDPDRGATSFTYDDAAQLLSTTDARPVTLSYVYDNVGREKELWQGPVSTGVKLADYTYDSPVKGTLSAANRYVGANTYSTAVTGYDDGYRPLGTTATFPSVEGTLSTQGPWTTSQTYNVDGSVASASLPAGGGLAAETLTYGYDGNGFPLTATGSQAYVSSTSYYPWGDVYQRLLGTSGSRVRLTTTVDEPTRRLTGNGVDTETPGFPGTFGEVRTDAYTYSPAGTVTSLAETLGGATVSNQCFNYDFLQRLTDAWTTTAATCQATPSQAVVGGPDSYWTSWSYNSDGGRAGQTQHATAGDIATSYTYPVTGGQRHTLSATTSTGPGAPPATGYTYDPVGNTATRTVGAVSQTLAWDGQARLASVTTGTQTTSYVYDAFGARLLRRDPDGSATAYLGGEELRKDPTGTITATRYYAGVASRTPSGLTWLASDHHNTAQIAVDATTLAVTTRRFTPFGDTRGSPPAWANTRGFLAGTADPTGLTHLGAREYDPSIGRFVSGDPLMDMADPQQWNGYAYANNNPVTAADPSGLQEVPHENPSSGGTPTQPSESAGSRVLRGLIRTLQGFLGIGGDEEVIFIEKTPKEEPRPTTEGGVPERAKPEPTSSVDYVHTTDPKAPKVAHAADSAERAMEANERGQTSPEPTKPVKSIDPPEQPKVTKADPAQEPQQSSNPSQDSCHSFEPNTSVLLADNTARPIGQIKIGDKVVATDPATGKTTAKPVVLLHVHRDVKLADVIVSTPEGVQTLHVTQNHPFYDRTRHAWVNAAALSAGDQLYTDGGTPVAVVVVATYVGSQIMNDLTVADIHTYYVVAGTTPVLVHNEGGWYVPDDYIVVRGGQSPMPGPGDVFSGSIGPTVGDAGAAVPHGSIRVTTAGEIRAAGGTVDYAPEVGPGGEVNYNHVNVTLGNSDPFSELEANPVAKGGRMTPDALGAPRC
jgi:RHS repeat-associated protein